MAAHSLLIERWVQAVWETDPHGVVIADSPSWRAYTGQTLQEWLGNRWLEAIHPDDRPYAERQWREETAAHGLVNFEFRLRAPDGGWRWTNVRAAPVLDAKGDIEKWVGINIDIDVRKRAELALRENEERQAFQLQLSDALASLSDPADIEAAAARLVAGQLGVDWCFFSEFDDRGTHATVLGDFHSDGLPTMVGVHDLADERDLLDLMMSETTLDMPDLTISELLSAQAKATYGALGICSSLGVPLLRNGRLAATLVVADTKARRWAQGDAELLKGVAERTWGIIQRARAHAAQEAAEKQVRLLETQLIHLSRLNAMGAMATTLAHELNQPLTAIENYAAGSENLVRDGGNIQNIGNALAGIRTNAIRAGEIIRRLREMTRKGEISKQPFKPDSLIKEAGELASAGACGPATIRYHFQDGKPVLGDPIQFQQVMINLICNACDAGAEVKKHNVLVRTELRGNETLISVEDNGPGIPPEELPSLFDAFYSTKHEGMGVGLSISRTIVEAHGGRIWAENKPEGGARFCFTLPLAEP